MKTRMQKVLAKIKKAKKVIKKSGKMHSSFNIAIRTSNDFNFACEVIKRVGYKQDSQHHSNAMAELRYYKCSDTYSGENAVQNGVKFWTYSKTFMVLNWIPSIAEHDHNIIDLSNFS